jgi:hypothetical protein
VVSRPAGTGQSRIKRTEGCADRRAPTRRAGMRVWRIRTAAPIVKHRGQP